MRKLIISLLLIISFLGVSCAEEYYTGVTYVEKGDYYLILSLNGTLKKCKKKSGNTFECVKIIGRISDDIVKNAVASRF